jgi:hypothetical protein
MKKKLPILLTLVVGLSAVTIIAQDAPPPGGPPPDRGPGGRGEFRRGEGFPRMPLMAALDPNNDGVIDEKEIEQASKSLKSLDKNSDGKITMEELRPARPEGGPERRRPEGGERPPRPERPPQKN